MFKNYIKIALRNIKKNKVFSSINIAGFAIGLSLCFILLVYIVEAFSYDKFHSNSENIYRIVKTEKIGDKLSENTFTPFPLTEVLKNDFPEVITATHLFKRSSESIKLDDVEFAEDTFYESDQEILNIFSFNILKGNKGNLLTNPHSVIISKTIQSKYFKNEDPIGKVLLIGQNQTPYNITGVFEDYPKESHFYPDFISSYNKNRLNNNGDWISSRYPNLMATYLLLNEETDPEFLENSLNNSLNKYYDKKELGEGNYIKYSFQNLLDIHLHSHYATEFEVNGNITSVYVMSLIAFLIIIIAAINFINLSTARSNLRAKEIGIRKVSGAESKQLIFQFLSESILVALFAFFLSLILIEFFIPVFNSLIGHNLGFNFINDFHLVILLFVLSIFLGFTSGIYPAFMLSALSVTKVLKNNKYMPGKTVNMRKILVVSQFVIATVLIISSILLLKQIDFLKNYDVGFDKEQVLVMPMMSAEVRSNYETFKTVLKGNSLVEFASGSNNPTGGRIDNNNQITIISENSNTSNKLLSGRAEVDYDYFETMGLELLEGRVFSKNYPSDLANSIIINQTTAKKLGLKSDIIGKSISIIDNKGMRSNKQIIGLIKDFHSRSMHEEINPLSFVLSDKIYMTLIRVDISKISESIKEIKKTFSELNPGSNFNFWFLDEQFKEFYINEEKTSSIISTFTYLAIFISCLGLLGLATFSIERKRKEVGIRKVLGASEFSIILLITNQFFKLILVANLIAWPISYYLIDYWLGNYAYKISIGLDSFLLGGILSLFVALLTIFYQTIKAATVNPVVSIKSE